ncbi:hypothetical protein [Amycolatopsis sp. YIM 10]|uniref:hypothetical protein n=1 Tax=Amycolatopsis sp. YIM 10 TaxID=2653857 RepID=UPI00128FEDFC|nr:hypothetical protein [Amycolatopsis sp. YIM 10]QFU85497.1 hypothetical protein YIM_01325 [Amycolatopsis sp. YIM 10]
MLKSLIEWFDKQLDERGPAAVFRGALAIIGITVALAAVPGVPMVKIGVLLFGIVTMVFSGLLLLRDRRRLREESARYQDLLARYCQFLAERPKAPYRISSWREVARIAKNGDVRGSVDVQLVTTRKEIYFLQFRFGPNWKQPAKEWKRAKFNIYLLQEDGTRVPDSEVTRMWDGDGRLTLTYHLHAPVRNGTKLHLEISWWWPGKAQPLMSRRTDEFSFNFARPAIIDYLSYLVVLPEGCNAISSSLGFADADTGYKVDTRTNEGRREFLFEGYNVPTGKRVGMRLQLV